MHETPRNTSNFQIQAAQCHMSQIKLHEEAKRTCSSGYSLVIDSQCCWAEAHVKIARMTLAIKLDGNWSSFQLANSAPPLSVTDSAIAPSARIPMMSSGAPGRQICKSQNTNVCQQQFNEYCLGASRTYLLGLLAMIKCSICSYQCDN